MNPDAALLRMLAVKLAERGTQRRRQSEDAQAAGNTRFHDYYDGYADGILFAAQALSEALGDEGFTEPEPAPYLKAIR